MAKRKKDYDQMTLEELYAAATEQNLPGRSNMGKEDLVAALKGSEVELMPASTTSPPPPPRPSPEDWPDPEEGVEEDDSAIKKEEEIDKAKAKTANIGDQTFVRAGYQLVNLSQVITAKLTSTDPLNTSMTLSMSNGTAVSLGKEETVAVMDLFGDCCKEEKEARKNAVKALKDAREARKAFRAARLEKKKG